MISRESNFVFEAIFDSFIRMKRTFLFLCFCVNFLVAQQTEYVDFKKARVGIVEGLEDRLVNGEVIFTFDVLKATDSIFINARNIEFQMAQIEKGVLRFKKEEGGYWLFSKFIPSINNKLFILYKAQPKKALYFLKKDNLHHIWSQGQGKYTSNWIPSFDDMNEKLEFDISVVFEDGYEVISNGSLIMKDSIDGFNRWHYDMEKPMSSYLVGLVIGKYDKKVKYSKSGVPLEMYYYPEDSLKFEPTYRYTKQMFDFFEEEIGVPYPWQNYKMVPVKDFLYAGMENTSLNIYSDAFVVDSIAFVDKNFVNINAHELAHQWFGDLVTATSGTHHWLQEGFATYYALLAEKDIFGDDYYYWRLYEYAQELKAQDEAGKSTSLLNPKSSSTTFYKKGCWVLHMLREKVGDEAFKIAIKNYLEKHQFKNVDTDDFISEVEKSSGDDLSGFVNMWLKSAELNYNRMIQAISSNKKVKQLISFDEFDAEIKVSEAGAVSGDIVNVLHVLKAYYADFAFRDSLNTNKSGYKDGESIKFYKIAFNSKDIKVRQAIAQNLTDIPSELKEDYESLLNDKSYITIEAALFNLWRNFPEDRTKYLNQTKTIVGFNDKNVRILWLTLALITEDYAPDNKSKYFQELTGYTGSQYGFEVRQNAFQYLHQIQACNDSCKENLKQAATHHNWRFKQFAKSLLEQE